MTIKTYYIWSFEHNAWWRKDWNGYTQDWTQAGEYSEEDAYQICRDANKHDLQEAMVPTEKLRHTRMNFIKLNSGVHINTDKLVWYYKHDLGVRYQMDGDPDPSNEKMSIEDFQNLLRGPAVTSPILELRLPKPNEPVMFKWEGKFRHGIVQSPQVEDDKIIIVSDGDEYQYDLPSSYTVKLQ